MKTPQVPAMAGMTPLGLPAKRPSQDSQSCAGMTNAEFRERIKGICGIRPANPLVTRTKTDRGYAPPCRHSTKLTGQCVKCGQYPYDAPKAAWIETTTECVLVGEVEGLR